MRDHDEIEIEYVPSEDAKSVVLEFRSSSKMTAFEFLMALVDFANDFAEKIAGSEEMQSLESH